MYIGARDFNSGNFLLRCNYSCNKTDLAEQRAIVELLLSNYKLAPSYLPRKQRKT